MSAREDLFESLMPVHPAQYAPGEEDNANSLLDDFLSEELAERAAKALEFMGPPEMPYESSRTKAFVDGWHAAVWYMTGRTG